MNTLTIKQTTVGKQINSNTFRLNQKYYRGRIEEARKHYSHHAEIFTRYSFEEYVNLTYININKPREAIKQELINICAKSMEASDMVKSMYLISKL